MATVPRIPMQMAFLPQRVLEAAAQDTSFRLDMIAVRVAMLPTVNGARLDGLFL